MNVRKSVLVFSFSLLIFKTNLILISFINVIFCMISITVAKYLKVIFFLLRQNFFGKIVLYLFTVENQKCRAL